ncbi:MAG: hypothetical protein AAFV43_02380 [Planctomycetota bacterium]
MADTPENPDMPDNDDGELLEALLDDRLGPPERAAAMRIVEADPNMAEQVLLQQRIDDSLRRSFQPPADGAAAVLRKLSRAADEPAVEPRKPASADRRLLAALLATAASIALAISLGILGGDEPREVAFKPRPLHEVYTQCVAEGFEPYWVCDDERLFAATFERRQGVPLALAELPEDRRMLGLAYLAGLSRDSTSLLGMVEGQRVLVLIDRADRAWEPDTDAQAGLNVFRWLAGGLVFYEVTPLDEPSFRDAFRFVDPQATEPEPKR